MLVFFYIITSLILISSLNIILYFSCIKLEIENLKIDFCKKPIIDDYRINIYLSFLNKFNYLKIGIYKEKIDKIKNLDLKKFKERLLMKLKVFNNKGFLENTNTIIKAIKQTNTKLEKMDIKADIGFNNAIVLSNTVALIDIIFSILLAKKTINNKSFIKNKTKFKYLITPRFTNNKFLKINVNAVFSLKISNIVKNIL